MKKEIVQLAIAGFFAASILAFQPAGRKQQVADSIKPEEVEPVQIAPADEIDSVDILKQAIKDVNKDTKKTVSRINKKIMLLQSEMMRTSLSAIWPDDRIIPPPIVGTPLPLPEPNFDTIPAPEIRRGLFRRRR